MVWMVVLLRFGSSQFGPAVRPVEALRTAGCDEPLQSEVVETEAEG